MSPINKLWYTEIVTDHAEMLNALLLLVSFSGNTFILMSYMLHVLDEIIPIM